PFMIESIRQSARKTHEELVDLNAKLDRLNALLSQGAASAPAGRPEPGGPETTTPRGRRGPASPDPPARPGGPRKRREPTGRGRLQPRQEGGPPKKVSAEKGV